MMTQLRNVIELFIQPVDQMKSEILQVNAKKKRNIVTQHVQKELEESMIKIWKSVFATNLQILMRLLLQLKEPIWNNAGLIAKDG